MEEFVKEQVGKDIHVKDPPALLQVAYGGVNLTPGTERTPTQVKHQPTVTWTADAHDYYTLVMNDPDAPSRADPVFREWLHWCVVNIPGADISKGQVLSDYMGSGPPKGTGLHRYVFLLYKQSSKLSISESQLGRSGWSVSKFVAKYSLGDPVAGNFFQAQSEKR